ncbi:MAG TPA: hypothetical protein VD929_10250 [Caulobacteraceae bacterium]|nr:hypothetical protein [Caulobacteraceae bacterium]
MQVLVDVIAAVVSALVLAALSHVGLDLTGRDDASAAEVRRTAPADPQAEKQAFQRSADDEDCPDEAKLKA